MLRVRCWGSVAVAAAFASVTIARAVSAAACGGGVVCACGDTVVASALLQQDLGVCAGVGLQVRSGAVLDCGGHTLTGSDKPGAWHGIYLDGSTGAEVRNCRVTAFRRAIRVRGGGSNVIAGNEVFGNRYGIEVASASVANQVSDNFVHDNRDEGIHVGTGCDGNEITGNEVSYSRRENLYLLANGGNYVGANVLHHSGQAALYMKHGRGNRIVGNHMRDRPVQLRGDSCGNTFEANELKGDGFKLEAYQNPSTGAWAYPHDNIVVGGRIRKTDWCFRFYGAYDNRGTDIVTDGRCTPMVEAERGGLVPSGNVVEVIPRP